MNFLADESVDRPIVERLRQEGYPVSYVVELGPGMSDDAVFQLASMVGRWKRRWKIERMNSWLLSYRRVNERKVENYVGFVHLACVRILLRRYFWDEF